MSRDTHGHGLVLRPNGAHGLEHFQRVAQAVFQAAAIFIAALIGQRRDKARQQIAVRTVQLQPVHAYVGRHLRSMHKLLQHLIHVGACHGPGDLAHSLQILLLRRCHDGPVALLQRQIRTFPGQPRRGLGTRMADLHGELGIGVGVNPVADAFPGLLLLSAISTWAAGRDAPLGADTGHLGKHQTGATKRTRPQVNEVKLTRHAINRRVLRHGRDHDTVLQRDAAQGIGQEHGRRRLGIDRDTVSFGQPFLITTKPLRITQAQVFMADALTAREHGIHELLGLQLVAIALAADLEPLHRIPGRILNAQRLNATRFLIGRQHLGNMRSRITPLLELACQLDRILDRQLGS